MGVVSGLSDAKYHPKNVQNMEVQSQKISDFLNNPDRSFPDFGPAYDPPTAESKKREAAEQEAQKLMKQIVKQSDAQQLKRLIPTVQDPAEKARLTEMQKKYFE